MALEIHPNLSALLVQRSLMRNQESVSSSMQRLSSGERISKVSDDPAGLATSQRLRSETRALQQVSRTLSDGLSMAQTAEDGLGEATNILVRMRELSTQAANGTLRDSDRAKAATEFDALRDELDRVAGSTEFAGQKLLSGALSSGANFAAGVDTSSGDISFSIAAITAAALGTSGAKLAAQQIGTAEGARTSLEVLDAAMSQVLTVRAGLGSAQAAFGHAMSRLAAAADANTTADGRIRDTDIARETAALTKGQMLSQAGVAVLAQANQLPQMALSLLRG